MMISELNLDVLSQRVQLSSKRCDEFVEACKVCLEEQQHTSGVTLRIEGMAPRNYILRWQGSLSQEIFDSWLDKEEATEHGACAIAFLIVLEIAQLKVIRRARKKTGVDYWLAPVDGDLLQDAGRLEISGIRKGKAAIVKGRVNQKLKQTKQSDTMQPSLPAYVVVVEFSSPLSHVEMRNV